MHAYKVRAVRAVRHRFHDQWLLITEDRMTFPILPTMMAVEELPKEMLDGNSAWLTLVKNAYEYSSDIIRIYMCKLDRFGNVACHVVALVSLGIYLVFQTHEP